MTPDILLPCVKTQSHTPLHSAYLGHEIQQQDIVGISRNGRAAVLGSEEATVRSCRSLLLRVEREQPSQRQCELQSQQPSRNDLGKSKKAKESGRQTNLLYLRSEPIDQILAQKEQCLRGISLFSGAGGFDLGVAQAGLETAVMIEWDKNCCWTLRANFTKEGIEERWNDPGAEKGWYPDFMKERIQKGTWKNPVILQRDITTVSTTEILKVGNFKVGEPFFVIGGPPCQGFSISGRRIIDDPRNKLYKEFVRIVEESYPRVIVFENVPGLVSMNKGRVMRQVAEDFAKCGYSIQWQLLNAAAYGVPQRRIRVILIGQRNDVMIIPEEGNAQIHFGGSSGPIHHPDWFVKRYSKEWAKTKDKCSVEEKTQHFCDASGDPYFDGYTKGFQAGIMPMPTHVSPERLKQLKELGI